MSCCSNSSLSVCFTLLELVFEHIFIYIYFFMFLQEQLFERFGFADSAQTHALHEFEQSIITKRHFLRFLKFLFLDIIVS